VKIIANSNEIDAWSFERAAVKLHSLRGIKGKVKGIRGLVNVAWVDDDSGERIKVKYK